jgi:pimeloyl-ACP methyl ester carboxylesterase
MKSSIFLVHGTFAKNAQWTQKDSALCATLRRELCTEDIKPIPWNGTNTTWGRQEGLSKLATELRKSLDANPANQHIVIGHSHGGTIALQAAASPEFFGKVAAILLSAPILVPRKRSFSYRLGFTMAFGAYFSAGTGLVLLAAILGRIWPALRTSSPILVPSCTIAAALALLLLYRHLRNLSTAVVTANGRSVPIEARLLIVRESADEASDFLGAFQLCSRAISMIFTTIEFAADSLERWTKKASTEPLGARTLIPNLILLTAALASVAFVLHIVSGTFHVSSSTTTTLVIFVIAAVGIWFHRGTASWLASHGYFMGVGMVLIPLWVLAFPIWLLLAIILFPIREAILVAPFVDLSAETTPEGFWGVHHFVPTADVFAGWGLSHSAPYNDPRVLKLIVRWIKERSL